MRQFFALLVGIALAATFGLGWLIGQPHSDASRDNLGRLTVATTGTAAVDAERAHYEAASVLPSVNIPCGGAPVVNIVGEMIFTHNCPGRHPEFPLDADGNHQFIITPLGADGRSMKVRHKTTPQIPVIGVVASVKS